MKLANDVLIEIVDIVRDGLVNGKDVSEALRQLDLVGTENALTLSSEYKKSKGRVV